jgi:rhomboid-like protein
MVQRYTLPVVLITALHCGVFLAWRVPQLSHVMNRYFTHSMQSLGGGRGGRVRAVGHYFTSLCLSTLSHQSFLHFAFNTMALVSIAPSIARVMGDRRFLTFYAATGIFSGIFAHAVMLGMALVTRRPGALAMIAMPSLGASGAVFGVFALSALLAPQQRFVIVFLPMFPIEVSL